MTGSGGLTEMEVKMFSGEEGPRPTLAEFQKWSHHAVQSVAQGKTVVLAPGGTSRWYFLEHGDPKAGYADSEQFREYGRRVIQRVVEIADMLFEDGVRTLFVMSWGVGQTVRGAEYLENVSWAYEMLADEVSQELYTQYNIGVLFRGQWGRLFERFKSPDLSVHFREVEEATAWQRERWLIWYVEDELIPERVVPLAVRGLQEEGRIPDRETLCGAYYGRPVYHIDIFIGNNKPNIAGMIPPLTTVGDAYFTVSPSLYMDQRLWRHILYDHVFARARLHREWQALKAGDVDEMRAFYRRNRDLALGIGYHHALSQTWRPMLCEPESEGAVE
jgi:hypothetical protein